MPSLWYKRKAIKFHTVTQETPILAIETSPWTGVANECPRFVTRENFGELGNCQCKSSSEEVEISVKEREEKTTDVSEHGTFGHYISLHIYATISLS